MADSVFENLPHCDEGFQNGARDKLKTENERLKKMLNDCRAEIESLRKQIHELKHGPGPSKNNIAGWTLAKSGDYFRLFKKVGGQVKGIHLGKVFDRDRALEKLKAKEKTLGIKSHEDN